jgi:hypothetical protein
VARDVFISYSQHDKAIADAVHAILDSADIHCRMAPLDPSPSGDWAAEIVQAIDTSKIFVLVFSGHCNGSVHLRNELPRAVNKAIPIIPFRVEDEEPLGAFALHLEGVHSLLVWKCRVPGDKRKLDDNENWQLLLCEDFRSLVWIHGRPITTPIGSSMGLRYSFIGNKFVKAEVARDREDYIPVQ